jgi:hypothetical protein
VVRIFCLLILVKITITRFVSRQSRRYAVEYFSCSNVARGEDILPLIPVKVAMRFPSLSITCRCDKGSFPYGSSARGEGIINSFPVKMTVM